MVILNYHNVISNYRNVVSNYRNVVSNYRNVISNYRNVIVNYRNVISNYRNVIPNYRNVISNYRNVIPNYRNVIYENVNVFYEKANVFYENVNVLYENVNVLYEEANVLYENTNVFYENTNVFYENTNVFYEKANVIDESGSKIDGLTYNYTDLAKNNQLNFIQDNITNTITYDIDGQNHNNYQYDKIGNLTQDAANNIQNITWTSFGKISQITKTDYQLVFAYDALGRRVKKGNSQEGSIQTYTTYDASGNIMGIYEVKPDAFNNHAPTLYISQFPIYGSSRIGVIHSDTKLSYQSGNTYTIYSNLVPSNPGKVFSIKYLYCNREFELTNHLGNVQVTISDKRIQAPSTGLSNTAYYLPDVLTATDYYPFGMQMPARTFTATTGVTYKFGFNDKYKDNDFSAGNVDGSHLDFGARIYDSRIGRWLSLDPLQKKYPDLSPYNFCDNNPIAYIDFNGEDLVRVTVPANSSGTKTKQIVVDRNIAAKVQDFAWAMNKEHGLVITNSFRSKEHQQELLDRWNSGDRKGLVCKPAKQSAHSAGMALDFNVKKGISTDEFNKLAETAKEFGAKNLGLSDRVHFYFDESQNGYKNRADATEQNDKYYKDHDSDESKIPEFVQVPIIKPENMVNLMEIKPAIIDNTYVAPKKTVEDIKN